MRLLVVGTTVEAAQALHTLLPCDKVEQLFHLAGESGPCYTIFSKRARPPGGLSCSHKELKKFLIRDRWGKKVSSLSLKGFAVHRLDLEPPKDSKLEVLPPKLEVERTRACEGTLEVGLSDGSDLLCDGVLFADGPRSRALVLAKDRPSPDDQAEVGCWSFIRQDLLDLKDWEVRWAAGKSVEQLPLPEGKVRVSLRFRSKHGSRLDPTELKNLFSEFGSDMEALFEDVEAEQIEYRQEGRPTPAFQPVPDCLALGEAGLGCRLLDAFDWRQELLRVQLEAVKQQVESGSWSSAEAVKKSEERAAELLEAELFFRSTVHYDNLFLRPLRDFLFGLIPDAFAASKLRARLEL